MIDEFYKSQNVLYGLELETAVYKYMPLKYVKAMVQNRTLRIDRVSRWEDTYENWFLKEKIQLENGQIGTAENLIPGVFGQCWSRKEESDAMWRIYSTVTKSHEDEQKSFEYLQNSAVRIKTTAKKIFDTIYLEDQDMASVYIGSVNYLSQDDFDNFVDSLTLLSPLLLNEVFRNSYFFKRDSFAHEEEIRPIIIIPNVGDDRFGKEYLNYSIDPDSFVEELVADPRLSEEEYQYVLDQLQEAGARPDCISQSKLYKFKQITIQLK